MIELSALFVPGVVVRNPEQPEWGRGQVQSNVDGLVTVNFEHTGKQVMNLRLSSLEVCIDER